MNKPPSNSDWFMCSMEILQMAIGKIASNLSELADQVPDVEWALFGVGVFVSEIHDVSIDSRDSELFVNVAEPSCGRPICESNDQPDSTGIKEQISVLWEATRMRKDLLKTVMQEVCKLNSGSLMPAKSVRMSDVAGACDLHITTVSRVLDNKTCQLNSNSYLCRDFIRV